MSKPVPYPANMRPVTLEIVENTLYVHCAEDGHTLVRLTLPATLDAQADDWQVSTDLDGRIQVTPNHGND